MAARNGSVAIQSEALLGKAIRAQGAVSALGREGAGASAAVQAQVARTSAREILGRGPGEARRSLVGTGGQRLVNEL